MRVWPFVLVFTNSVRVDVPQKLGSVGPRLLFESGVPATVKCDVTCSSLEGTPPPALMRMWTGLRALRAAGMLFTGIGLEALPPLLRAFSRDLNRLLKVSCPRDCLLQLLVR